MLFGNHSGMVEFPPTPEADFSHLHNKDENSRFQTSSSVKRIRTRNGTFTSHPDGASYSEKFVSRQENRPKIAARFSSLIPQILRDSFVEAGSVKSMKHTFLNQYKPEENSDTAKNYAKENADIPTLTLKSNSDEMSTDVTDTDLVLFNRDVSSIKNLGNERNGFQESSSVTGSTTVSEDLETNGNEEYDVSVPLNVTEDLPSTFATSTAESFDDSEATIENLPQDDISTITTMPLESETESSTQMILDNFETELPSQENIKIVPLRKNDIEALSVRRGKAEIVHLEEEMSVYLKENTDNTKVVEENTQDVLITEEITTVVPVTMKANQFDSKGIRNTLLPITEVPVAKEYEKVETILPSEEIFMDFQTTEAITYTDIEDLRDATETISYFADESEESLTEGTLNEHPTSYSSGAKSADLNNTDTAVIFLETSLGVEQVTTEGPLEPTSFDVKIKTIKDLKVEAIFDPSQIAKATSYEESSYSTATRSATVTTWVDPNRRNIVNLKEGTNSSSVSERHGYENVKSQTENFWENTNSSVTGTPIVSNSTTNITFETTITSSGNESIVANEKDSHNLGIDVSKKETLPPEFNLEGFGSEGPEIPVFKFNLGGLESINGSRIYLSESNKNGTRFVYEMPDINRSSGPHLTPSVVIALSICCSFVVLLSILTVVLWFCRRHRNRSKIYLSRDAARPRAFFTKPMNPALLPDETTVPDSMYFMEFQKPRPPIVLSDDPDCVVIDEEAVLHSNLGSNIGGIENQGFVDIPLGEIKSERSSDNSKSYGVSPPKPGLKGQCESDVDSGIRVWSSTGSLFAMSTESSHCFLPPPPYDSSIGKESDNLSSDAFPSYGSKFRFLYA